MCKDKKSILWHRFFLNTSCPRERKEVMIVERKSGAILKGWRSLSSLIGTTDVPTGTANDLAFLRRFPWASYRIFRSKTHLFSWFELVEDLDGQKEWIGWVIGRSGRGSFWKTQECWWNSAQLAGPWASNMEMRKVRAWISLTRSAAECWLEVFPEVAQQSEGNDSLTHLRKNGVLVLSDCEPKGT